MISVQSKVGHLLGKRNPAKEVVFHCESPGAENDTQVAGSEPLSEHTAEARAGKATAGV
jgi:hypothetical protein